MIRSGEPPKAPMGERHRTPITLAIGSMLALVTWLVFILLYALIWSNGYSLFQNIVVTFVSLGIVALLIGVMWMAWGWRRFGSFDDWRM